MKQEIIKASEFGLENKQVNDVDTAFSEKVKERELIGKIYGQLIEKDIDKEVAKEARELRLRAVKLKTGIAQIHKSQKEFALAFGKYCDAWKRKETEPVQQMIDGALEIEKFEEIQEQKRLDNLQKERVELLSPYVEDAYHKDLSGMDDDVWEAYLKKKKDDHKAIKEAEEKAEKERLEREKQEAEERERIKKENELLKKEAEERERKIKEEQKIQEEEKRKQEIEAQKQKEEYEKKLAKERLEKERIEKEAEEKRLSIEKELNEKKQKEEEEKKAKYLAEQEELNKDDASKMLDLISEIKSVGTKYSFKSEKNIKKYDEVRVLMDKVIEYINK